MLEYSINKGYLRKVQSLLPMIEKISMYMQENELNLDANVKRLLSIEMAKFGYLSLGSGVNAQCFDLGDGNVIRIEMRYNKKGMSRWLDYVENNQCAITPKIFFKGKFILNKKFEVFISVTEKLVPIKPSVFFKRNQYDIGITNLETFFKINKAEEKIFWSSVSETLREDFDLNKLFPLDLVIKIKRDFRKMNDVHGGNIMFSQKSGKFILTDPIN